MICGEGEKTTIFQATNTCRPIGLQELPNGKDYLHFL